MNQTTKLALTVCLTLVALLIVTVGWTVGLLVRLRMTANLPPGGTVAMDPNGLLKALLPHNAPFYWLTLLLVIVLAGLAYRRWAM